MTALADYTPPVNPDSSVVIIASSTGSLLLIALLSTIIIFGSLCLAVTLKRKKNKGK